MDITTSQFMLMYSLYSWPNVIICFFGGYLIDRWLGIRSASAPPISFSKAIPDSFILTCVSGWAPLSSPSSF